MNLAKILIVEHETAIAEDLQTRLADLNYVVAAIVGTGEAAIEAAKREQPALVLIDIDLKGNMDAASVAKCILEELAIPAVYLTAHADTNLLARAEAASPAGYLAKPFNTRDIQITLAVALHRQEMAQKLRADGRRSSTTLRETEERYWSLFDRFPDSVYLHDFQGRFIDANPAALKLFGYTREEVPTLDLFSLIDQSQMPLVMQTLEELKRTGSQEKPTQYKVRCKSGQYMVVETIASVIYREGVPFAVQGIARDVTERQRAEQILRESEATNRALLATVPDLMFRVGRDGRYLGYVANQGHMLYVKPDQFMDKTVTDVLPVPVATLLMNCTEQALSSGNVAAGEYELEVAGDHRWFEARVVASGEDEVLQIIRDITDRHRAEQAVWESRQMLQLVLDTIPVGVFWKDRNFVFLGCNQTCARDTALNSPAEIVGKSDLDFIRDANDRKRADRYRSDDRRIIETGRSELNYEEVAISPDGRPLWLRTSKVPLRDRNGDIIGILGTYEDITDRKLAQNALHESESRFRQFAGHIDDVFWMMDPQLNQIIYINPAYERVWLRKCDELYRNPKSFLEAIHPDDRERMCAHLGHPNQRSEFSIEYRLVWPDGSIRWIWDRAFPIRDEAGRVVRVAGIATDITNRKHAEEAARRQQEQLAHLSRVAVAGEMASSLAHEINQPLGAIVNYAGICLDQIKAPKPAVEMLAEALQEIGKEAQRAAVIIQRFRDFVRKRQTCRQPLDINTVVKDAVGLVALELRAAGIQPRLELAPRLTNAWADAVQVQQVLVNLLKNAVESMADTPSAERELIVRTSTADDAVHVSVSDAGCGIPHQLRESVFDSFFTTKPQGLGMGLAISRSIVESHGGRLSATDNAGRGTTFAFTLPPAMVRNE